MFKRLLYATGIILLLTGCTIVTVSQTPQVLPLPTAPVLHSTDSGTTVVQADIAQASGNLHCESGCYIMEKNEAPESTTWDVTSTETWSSNNTGNERLKFVEGTGVVSHSPKYITIFNPDINVDDGHLIVHCSNCAEPNNAAILAAIKALDKSMSIGLVIVMFDLFLIVCLMIYYEVSRD